MYYKEEQPDSPILLFLVESPRPHHYSFNLSNKKEAVIIVFKLIYASEFLVPSIRKTGPDYTIRKKWEAIVDELVNITWEDFA
jgi:hypothetical protein